MRTWIMSHSTLDAAAKVPAALAALAGDEVFLIGGAEGAAGVTTRPTKDFQSAAALLATTEFPVGTEALLLDIENWDQSPVLEQRDPAPFYSDCSDFAHGRGYAFVGTPGADLKHVGQPQSSLLPAIAGYCDVLDIQAQNIGLDDDPAAYVADVQPLAEACQAVSSNLVVISGLSTLHQGVPSTAANLAACAAATAAIVDGWWLNVPDGNVAMATEFLTLLGPG
jgi:hypothetical protein